MPRLTQQLRRGILAPAEEKRVKRAWTELKIAWNAASQAITRNTQGKFFLNLSKLGGTDVLA